MHCCGHKASKHYDKKIPIISNADLSARSGVQKRGLQARAVNALHCNAFLAIIIIIVVVVVDTAAATALYVVGQLYFLSLGSSLKYTKSF